jgi:hypothetical protein
LYSSSVGSRRIKKKRKHCHEFAGVGVDALEHARSAALRSCRTLRVSSAFDTNEGLWRVRRDVTKSRLMAGSVGVLAAHYRNLIDMGFANHAYEIQCQGFTPHPEPDRGSPPNPEL